MVKGQYSVGALFRCITGVCDVKDYYESAHLIQEGDLLHIVGLDHLRSNRQIAKIKLIRKGKIHKDELFVDTAALDPHVATGSIALIQLSLDPENALLTETAINSRDNSGREICFWCGRATEKIRILTFFSDYCHSCKK